MAVRFAGFLLMLVATLLAARQFGPWAGVVALCIYAATLIEVIARCHLLRLRHAEDVELIDEHEVPRLYQLALELENRVRTLEIRDAST